MSFGKTGYRDGGNRGGHDRFQWDQVKEDKYRENYLGHSLKVRAWVWPCGCIGGVGKRGWDVDIIDPSRRQSGSLSHTHTHTHDARGTRQAPVGRWQKGKDLQWYTKAGKRATTAEEQAEARRAELAEIRQRDEDLINEALGLAPKRQCVHTYIRIYIIYINMYYMYIILYYYIICIIYIFIYIIILYVYYIVLLYYKHACARLSCRLSRP